MKQSFLFVGGVKDGKKEYIEDVPSINFPNLEEISLMTDDNLIEPMFTIHRYRRIKFVANGKNFYFFLLDRLEEKDCIQKLIDTYSGNTDGIKYRKLGAVC